MSGELLSLSVKGSKPGEELPYISYIGMYPPALRVGFLRLFGLKTDTDFAHFGLELGMVFVGTTGVYERFHSKCERKTEKYANSKWFEEFFCLRSNLSNDDIISTYRPGLKIGVDFSGLV